MVKSINIHPFHSGIGGVLRHIIRKYNKIKSGGKYFLSGECGGNHNLPLFIRNDTNDTTGNATELCNVDAIIKTSDAIGIIIEIEESGYLPTKICGKYLTSNLAKYYQYKKIDYIPFDSLNISFIQIIDMRKQSKEKEEQFRHIEKAIKNLINVAEKGGFEHGCIKEYNIVLINAKKINGLMEINNEIDENEYNKTKEYAELINIIEAKLGI